MSLRAADPRLRLAAWAAIAAVALIPVALALASPLLPGREALWLVGGMAGVVAMSLLFVQPLLTAAAPALLSPPQGLRWHRAGGTLIVVLVALHVGALYLASPDDITDALLLVAPTPFSVYGVIGLWCLVLTAVLAALRRRTGLPPRTWRMVHSVLGVAVVGAAAIHAVRIEGAMEEWSKYALCVAALVAATAGALEVNVLAPLRRRRG